MELVAAPQSNPGMKLPLSAERAVRAALLAVGILAGTALLAGLVLALGTDPRESDDAPRDEAPSALRRPQELQPLSITADAALPSYSGNSYEAANLVDQLLGTAWAVGAGTDPIGRVIEVTFPNPVELSALEIANGYQKNEDTFRRNGRVRYLLLTFEDGTSSSLELEDRTGWQYADILDATSRQIDIKVVDIYPGRDENLASAALSEIRFLGEANGR
ncbi:MAG: hypothetical protein Kow00129_01290 [Thermoleophilia bacterium]